MVSEQARDARSPRTPRRGLVLGCGGTLGGAWSTAMVLEVSRALGWDPREASVLYGTSAGATLALLLAAGISADTLLAAQLGATGAPPALAAHFASPPPKLPPVPRGGPASLALFFGATTGLPAVTALAGLLPEGRGDTRFLAELAENVAPDASFGRARLVAVDAATGARVAFGSSRAPRATVLEALRASWAIPGWLPSVRVGDRRYVDGGVRSPTSVDLAASEGVDELVVLAPMTSTARGPGLGGKVVDLLRRAMRATLDAEIAEAERAGVRVLRLEPTAEDVVAFGANMMNGAARLRVLETALRTARRNVRDALARAPAFAPRAEGDRG